MSRHCFRFAASLNVLRAQLTRHFHFLTCWLVAHAARRAPGNVAARLEEEWLAALNEQLGLMARLRLALGCCWAAAVIAREHAENTVRNTPTLANAPFVDTRTRDQPASLSRRAAVLATVLCLHVLVISALVTRFSWPGNSHPDIETTVDLTLNFHSLD
jgi:hypothetical protein